MFAQLVGKPIIQKEGKPQEHRQRKHVRNQSSGNAFLNK